MASEAVTTTPNHYGRAKRCVYCARRTTGGDACTAHADLLELDPYMQAHERARPEWHAHRDHRGRYRPAVD